METAKQLVPRLLRVAQLLDDRAQAGAGEDGMGRGERDVLLALLRSGPPFRLTPSKLAAALRVRSGTMTSRLDRLEARGLVERIPSKKDRRSVDVALTRKGRELGDGAAARQGASDEELLAPLSAKDRDRLTRITRKLIKHLEQR